MICIIGSGKMNYILSEFQEFIASANWRRPRHRSRLGMSTLFQPFSHPLFSFYMGNSLARVGFIATFLNFKKKEKSFHRFLNRCIFREALDSL